MFRVLKTIIKNIAKNGIKKTNGKKTIGGIALCAAGVSIKLIPELQSLEFASDELIYAGVSLAGVGATHKVIKHKKKES